MYDESLTSAFYQEYSAKLHKKKLEQIKNRKNFTLSLSLDPHPKEPKKPKGFLKIAKMQEVSRENKLLHEKLMVISKRKTSAEAKFHTNSPKTLNFGIRKKLSDQIIQENSSIIQRLIDRPAKISVKQMRIDYELSQKYKENLSKKKGFDRIRKIVKKFNLPALNEPLGNGLTIDSHSHRVSSTSDC